MNLAIPWVSDTLPTLKLWCTQSTAYPQTWPGSAFLKMMSLAFSPCMVSDAGEMKHPTFPMMIVRKALKCCRKHLQSAQSPLGVFGKYVPWQKHHTPPNVCILTSVLCRTSPSFPWWPCEAHRIRKSSDTGQVWPHFVLGRCHHPEGRNPVL